MREDWRGKGAYYALRRTETAWKNKIRTMKTVKCPRGAVTVFFASREEVRE